jgi:putative nucleotidyltransferase with HDIG domain
LISDKRRILFVDDEPRVLDGLRRMLFPMRHEWEMLFAESGQEALNMMTKDDFDVVVTDMRMPGMSGAEFLSEVRKRNPQTVRIVLSGQTKRDTILRSIAPIHQFLSKPCDADTIKSVLVRAFTLRKLLSEEGLKQLVSQVESLPSLPSIYHEVVEALQSEDTSLGVVGEIISKDISMSAKMLQLVNSAFFGLPRNISNPSQAVVLLGLDTVKSLVLSIHMFSQFDQSKLRGLSLDVIWRHSIAVGGFAKLIAKYEGADTKMMDDAFMAGMLHDVGKLVLATNFPDKYLSVLTTAKDEGIQVHEAEYKMFQCSHAEVGAYMLGLWGLPDSLIMASAFHHCPINHPERNLNTLAIIHLANVFDYEVNPARRIGAIPTIDHNYLTELAINEQLPKWRSICQKSLNEGDDT